MLNEWIVAWVVHQAPRNPLHLFDGNIFYPERSTLAYSEPMMPQAAMAAPLLAIGASPVLGLQPAAARRIRTTGWSMCLVVEGVDRRLGGRHRVGRDIRVQRARLTRIPHLQAQHVEFLPLALLALDGSWSVRPLATYAPRSVERSAGDHLRLPARVTLFSLAAAVLSRPHDWLGQRFAPFAAGAR